MTSSHTIVVRAQVLFKLYIVEDTRFETLWSQILENLTLFSFRLNTRENIGRHTEAVVLKFFVERTDFI